MPNIELSDIVKEKLDRFKEGSGSKTYSDAINFCLLQTELLRQNQELLKEIKERQEILTDIKEVLIKRNFNKIFKEIAKEFLNMSDSEREKLKKNINSKE